MKPIDIPNKLIKLVAEEIDSEPSDWGVIDPRDIIASVFNTITTYDEPITASWLYKNEYEPNYEGDPAFTHTRFTPLRIFINRNVTVFLHNHPLHTKTIGQLLCLHAALGINPLD